MLDKRQINDKFTFPYMGMSAHKTMKALNLVCYFCVFYLHIKTEKRMHTKMKTQTTHTHMRKTNFTYHKSKSN